MNEYLLGGVAVALLVLLLVARSLRRRPVVRRPRSERSPVDVEPPTTRRDDELDTISEVHELPDTRPMPDGGLQRRTEQEVVEGGAQPLSPTAHEHARLAAESGVSSGLDWTTLPPTAPGVESDLPTQPSSAFDEQALLEALAREAAEWEARLAEQQQADAERQAAEAAEAAAQARRVAEEQAAQARAEQLAVQRAQQLEAERQAQEAAAARAVAEQLAQAEAAAQQPAAVSLRELAMDLTPEAKAAPSGAALPPVVEPVPRAPEHCLVMVADDSKVVRVKTSRLLAKHAYRVVLAEDGLDALRQIADEAPDVLITDVEMPNMDGFALTRQLRNDPRTTHIPIVMITADDQKHRAEALDAGVSVLLSKPYPEEELLSYLQSTLAGLVPTH